MQPDTVPALKLFLLGPFQALLNDKPITEFRADSARGLLAYLAMRPGTDFRRETLATLLWPERSQDDALVNFRQILTLLRRALGDQEAATPFLLVTPQTVQFNPESRTWLDVNAFTQSGLFSTSPRSNYRLNIPAIRQAVEMYRGEFLDGFALDSEPFDEWLVVQREQFHRQVMDLLMRLATYHERRGEFQQVEMFAIKQLELEPWLEEAHCQLMLAYAQTGQRSAALVQYAKCQRAFAQAFGLEPSAPTLELYRAIAQSDVENKQFTPAVTHFNNLPAQTTPLIGRAELVAQIEECLVSSNHRLVTLLGPGGVGKTRLAVLAADHLRGSFADGICYVSFADQDGRVSPFSENIKRPNSIGVKLSNVLRLVQSDTKSPDAMLLDYLRDKEMLIVMDDLETLLDAAADFIAEVLRQAANVVFLTTTRQPLGLVAESVFRIPGLPVPARADPAAADADSVRLFVERAQRASPEFQLHSENLPDVIAICQFVDGLPLGIELAAVWTKYNSPSEIVHLLADQPEKMEMAARDLPTRHRSLRAVFERSWQLLSAAEQNTLSQATVFCGGFDLSAARSVIAGDWNIQDALRGLHDHSLIQRDAAGRYYMHPPIEKFAAGKMRVAASAAGSDAAQVDPPLDVPTPAGPDAPLSLSRASLQARHSTYFLDWVSQLENSLQGHDVRRGLESFQCEWENIARAWNWATEHKQIALLAKSVDGLTAWLGFLGRFQEGENLARQAVQLLCGDMMPNAAWPSGPNADNAAREPNGLKSLVCRLLLSQAQFHTEANAYADALGVVKQAQALADELADSPLQAAGHLHRGIALRGMGDYTAAQAELDQIVTHARAIFNQPNHRTSDLPTMAGTPRLLIARGLESASLVALSREMFAAAREDAQHALALYRDLGNNRDELQVHLTLGLIAASGAQDLEQARIHFTDALNRASETGNYFHETMAKKNLGYAALALGQLNEARAYLEYALRTYREYGNKPMQADTHCHLAVLFHQRGESRQALEHSQQATDLAHQFGEPFRQAVALTGLGYAQLGLGNLEQARSAFQAALAGHDKLGQPTCALTPRAGIVEAALADGAASARAEASAMVECIYAQLQLGADGAHPRLGITALYNPFSLYLTCARFLERENDPRAETVLRHAHRRLNAHAEKISDGELRMGYLENVPTHREISKMWDRIEHKSLN